MSAGISASPREVERERGSERGVHVSAQSASVRLARSGTVTGGVERHR